MRGLLGQAVLAATLVLVAAPAGRAEVVQLIDGKLIKGEIYRRTKTHVFVRTRPHHTVRIDRRLIRGVYKDNEKIPPPPPGAGNPALPPRGGWPKPYPTLTVEREQQIVKRVNEILKDRDAAERAKLLNALAEADRALIPSVETIERWLAEPRRYPGAAGKPLRIDLPWKGKNPRAIAVVGVPTGYDPAKHPWPLVFALHGTEDKPDASVSHTRDVLKHGCFMVAPRTLHKAHLWYHPEDQENIFRIIGHLADHYRIDPRRIVMSGGSGGGMGTWGLATLHPELYCAAASSAGMPPIRPQHVSQLRTVPFFFMHGVKDFIPVAGPRRMHAEMTKLKIEHVYLEHEGGHYPSLALQKKKREWMQKAPAKNDCSPRPAVLQFIGLAADARPLPAPPGTAPARPAEKDDSRRGPPARK